MIGRLFIALTTLALIVGAIGCGGGGNALSPDLSDSKANTAEFSQDIGTRNLWGMWDVTIDTRVDTAEIVPMRGANFTANVNNMLEGQPGNLIIGDMDLANFQTEGRLDCTVSLKHPFPGLDQFHGFDVWGVFLHNGSASVGYDNLTYSDGSGSNDAMLLNPDG
ncbi:MAG TPA: hypothetical protein ENN67_05780 [Firmicutes bacterium]|nr:hypothetical protein [Bacillota bacterium]